MTWLPATVTAAPASEPLTLAEAQSQVRVDSSDFDTELTGLIQQARAFVESYTGTKLVSQTVSLKCSDWCDLANLPIAPIISVSSVKYLDTDGVEQALATSVYELVNEGLSPSIRLKINQSWPSVRPVSDAIRVVALAGYSSLPVEIKRASLLLISRWFDDRAEGDIPEGVKALLVNHRKF